LNEIQAFELQFVFRHWIGPVKWILAKNGEYYRR
jgi:hypothetical protein